MIIKILFFLLVVFTVVNVKKTKNTVKRQKERHQQSLRKYAEMQIHRVECLEIENNGLKEEQVILLNKIQDLKAEKLSWLVKAGYYKGLYNHQQSKKILYQRSDVECQENTI